MALGEAYGVLAMKLQRSLNQAVDSDRMSRRAGLTALRSGLLEKEDVDARARRQYFALKASAVAVEALSDSVEKCRECAIALLTGFAGDVPAPEAAMEAACARVGATPYPEPSEELRLGIAQLALALFERHGVAGPVVEALPAALVDAFPEAKRAWSRLAGAVARSNPEATRPRAEAIVRATIVNLGHQHAKTRGAALEALRDLAPLAPPEPVVSALFAATFDRSAAVRTSVAACAGHLVARGIESARGVLVDLKADEDAATAEAAAAELERAGGVSADRFQSVLEALGARCRHWRREARCRGGASLMALCATAPPECVASRAPDILALGSALCGDDDDAVRAEGARACGAVGRVAARETLDALVPRVADAVASSAQRARDLDALGAALAAMTEVPERELVARALAEHAWLDDPSRQGLATSAAALQRHPLTDPAERDILVAALLTDSSASPEAVARLAPDVATRAIKPPIVPRTRQHALLDALVRRAPAACRAHLDIFLPLVLPLTTNPDVELRVSGLATLHALVAGGPIPARAAETVLSAAVEPNLVWQAGKTALTARKAALAVLHALFSRASAALRCPPDLVASLRTSMDDHDATSRELALACLGLVFATLDDALDDDVVSATYPALLKRLDDSNDNIRLKTCAVLVDFLRLSNGLEAAPVALDYTTEQLLVHLDDPRPDVQAAVFNVLDALVKKHNKPDTRQSRLLKTKITNVKPSHRDPHYCDTLLNTLLDP